MNERLTGSTASRLHVILDLCLFARLGGHQIIELRVMRELVGKGHERTAHPNQPVPRVHVGDVGKLEVGNVQQLGKLYPVGAGLIEHDNKLTVGQHGTRRVALQKIVHILRDARTKSAILPNTLPEREQKVGAVLMLE